MNVDKGRNVAEAYVSVWMNSLSRYPEDKRGGGLVYLSTHSYISIPPLITALQLVTRAALDNKAVPNEKLTNMDSMNVHVRSYNTAMCSLIIYLNILLGIQ